MHRYFVEVCGTIKGDNTYFITKLDNITRKAFIMQMFSKRY